MDDRGFQHLALHMNPLERLDRSQRARLTGWLGDFTFAADYSWPLQTTAVLELETANGQCIAKAATGCLTEHDLAREIRAHREVLVHLGDGFPQLLHADEAARLLVTRYLPGVIAEGTIWESDPGVHRAAGALLSRLHSSGNGMDSAQCLPDAVEKTRGLLDRGRELFEEEAWAATMRLLNKLDELDPAPVRLVPTHGDFQPRNWLVDPDRRDPNGTPDTSLIDFGRFDYRPWYSDLVRLHHQGFAARPDLAGALFEGAGWTFEYPAPPEDRTGWLIENLLQSVGTVVWATGINDLKFADQGRSMLARTLVDARPTGGGVGVSVSGRLESR